MSEWGKRPVPFEGHKRMKRCATTNDGRGEISCKSYTQSIALKFMANDLCVRILRKKLSDPLQPSYTMKKNNVKNHCQQSQSKFLFNSWRNPFLKKLVVRSTSIDFFSHIILEPFVCERGVSRRKSFRIVFFYGLIPIKSNLIFKRNLFDASLLSKTLIMSFCLDFISNGRIFVLIFLALSSAICSWFWKVDREEEGGVLNKL